MSLNIQSSRFALLKVDDDSDDGAAKPAKKNTQSKATTAKKNKKKNKAEKLKVETDELRHLAFGLAPARKGKDRHQHGQGDATASQGQWEEWKNQDTEFAAETYEKDLQQALLLSKLEMEQQKEDHLAADVEVNDDNSGKKKKKKNKKKGTMSLDEFNQPEKAMPPTTDQVKDAVEADTKFFDRVDDDVTKIVRKEIIQDEYRKHYRVESSQILHYHEAIAKRDAEIAELKETVSKLQEQLAETESRNKKMSQMLSKGEMKSKAAMLLEMNQIKQVRDELTAEVTSLTTQLEIERSRAKSTNTEKHEKSKSGKQ